MSTRSSSASDLSDTFSVRYQNSKTTTPSLESIEQLLQLNAALQAEISAQLSAVVTSIEKDIKVTQKCVFFDATPTKSRNSLISQLEDVHREQQDTAEQLMIQEQKSKALRERFSVIKRQASIVPERVRTERLQIEEKKSTLAKADKALNDAARLIAKAQGKQLGIKARGEPKRRDSGVKMDIDTSLSE